MKYFKLIAITCALFFFSFNLLAQPPKKIFSQQQIDSVRNAVTGLSGSGKLIVGDDGGGWCSGSAGVMYNTPYHITALQIINRKLD